MKPGNRCVACLLLWFCALQGSALAETCPVTAFDQRTVFLSAPPEKLVGDGRFCPAAEVPASAFHYGFGLSVGRVRPATMGPGADIIVSDSQPPRLSYLWFDRTVHQFRREVIYDGSSLSDCERMHAVPQGEDCLIFESNFVADINCDGYDDVVVISYRHPTSIFWFENPGTLGAKWKRHPITDEPFADGKPVNLVSGASAHSQPPKSVFSAAPFRRGSKCKSGVDIVDIVFGAHSASGPLKLLKNPASSGAQFAQKWEALPLPGTESVQVRTLMQVPTDGANKPGKPRLLYAPMVEPALLDSTADGKRKWNAPASPYVLDVSPSDPLQVVPARVDEKGYGFAVGTFARIRPVGPKDAVIPYGTATQFPCTPPWVGTSLQPPTDSGVYAYGPRESDGNWTMTARVYAGSEFPWPHHVTAGRVSRHDVDDLVIGTMCTKPQPYRPGEIAWSKVVYCANPLGAGSQPPVGAATPWHCVSLAERLPGVPFVGIADVDGDGINDVVAQTNGLPPFVSGRLLWFKGLRRPTSAATPSHRQNPAMR